MHWERALFLAHRRIGIGIGIGIGMFLPFTLWFASGIVVVYVDYPELTYAESEVAHPA